MKTIKLLILSTLLMSASLFAGQSKDFGNLEVHYIALPSTFLQPNITKIYDIKRSAHTGLVNIAVLDKHQKLKAQKAHFTGTGKNLIGQSVELKFQEIVEGESIYYIATYQFTNEEIVNFDIKIKTDKKTNKLKFQHKFYVE